MGICQTNPFCVTAKISSRDHFIHKNITKNKVSLQSGHIFSIFCETFFFLDLKFCFENMKILLFRMHQNSYGDLRRSFLEIRDHSKSVSNRGLSKISFRNIYFKLNLKVCVIK